MSDSFTMKKFICTTTGRTTQIHDADDWRNLQDRANALIGRTHPGHFAPLNFGKSAGLVLKNVEICRSVGGMTEGTGEFVDFEIAEYA
jgi:hypothetical protein